MKKIITGMVVLIVSAVSLAVAAQAKTITISGKITSFEESLPLEGVSIVVKGDSISTGTQADGSFSLPVVPGEKRLLITLAGYEKQDIPITRATEYNIVLKRGSGFGPGAGCVSRMPETEINDKAVVLLNIR